jgi:hypothetical protein
MVLIVGVASDGFWVELHGGRLVLLLVLLLLIWRRWLTSRHGWGEWPSPWHILVQGSWVLWLIRHYDSAKK